MFIINKIATVAALTAALSMAAVPAVNAASFSPTPTAVITSSAGANKTTAGYIPTSGGHDANVILVRGGGHHGSHHGYHGNHHHHGHYGHHAHYGHHGHHGYYHHRHHHHRHHHSGWGYVGAAMGGLAIGSIIANDNR